MAKTGMVLLISISFWVYYSRATGDLRLVQLGEKCESSLLERIDLVGSEDIGNLTSCDPSVPLECSHGRCTCKRGYTISRNGTNCLEIARNGLESSCEESIQCWKSLLGRLSECVAEVGKCQCYESETLPIVFHQGRCYYGESLGDYCQIDGLCSATTPNASCRAKDTSSIPTCQCTEGYVPSWDKSRCLRIATHGLISSCEENIQCEKSPLGTLSECNQERMQCQCYQIPMVPTVFHLGRCYFGASLGDVCQVTAQCLARTENSVCGKDGKCKCIENGDAGFVPNANLTLCLPIVSSDGSASECIENVQCTRALGHFSRCNLESRKCECFSPEGFSKQQSLGQNFTAIEVESTNNLMIIVGAKCYSTKQLGLPCKYNQQCSALTPHSVCNNGNCECEERAHIISSDGRKCLEIGKEGYGSACDENQQCSHSILGPLSHCDPETRKCSCSNVLPVVFYNKKCYFHRQLGASCESDDECKAGRNAQAVCVRGRCQCENGTRPYTDHSCISETRQKSGVGQVKPRHIITVLLIIFAFLQRR